MKKIILTETKKISRAYDRLFKRIDRASCQSNQSGFMNDSENEYMTDAGYVLEFKAIHDDVATWIKTQKNIDII